MEKTILVVDDFENSLFITAVTLQNKGYNVIKANSAPNALKALNGQPVHLIITDYNMPQINGLQLVEKIKEIPRYIKAPIFVLSTEIKEEVKSKAYKLGVSYWIKKPFDINQLLKMIEKVMS